VPDSVAPWTYSVPPFWLLPLSLLPVAPAAPVVPVSAGVG
jgi:hypothetical protein